MRRRHFLNCAIAAPIGGALLGAEESASQPATPPAIQEKKAACRITVLRCSLNKDFSKEYANNKIVPCEIFSEGQQFTAVRPHVPPGGFCLSAWSDMRQYIFAALAGRRKPMISCCTDGYRPVFFKIERVEEV
jgi:uncharacterized repeat protein (TIGR04076 family)